MAGISMLHSPSVTQCSLLLCCSTYGHTYDKLKLYVHLFVCIVYLFHSIPQMRDHSHFIQHNMCAHGKVLDYCVEAIDSVPKMNKRINGRKPTSHSFLCTPVAHGLSPNSGA